MKPIEGASKGGIKGFLKGAFQGVTGLIIKPVTGVLDAASNTAEGIKNTATAFDQKPNENRMRYPRAFYGKDKFYRTYMETDAEVMWMLHFSEEETAHRDISILSSYDVFPEEKENPDFFILIISFEKILMWYVKLGRVLWVVKSSNIAKVTHENNGVLLHLKEATEVFKVLFFSFGKAKLEIG